MSGVLVLARSDDPDRPSPLVHDLVRTLTEQGLRVRRLDPDRDAHDLQQLPEEAAVVLKSGTEAALSFAGALEVAGHRVVNPASVAAACRDKVVQTRVLHQAGVPLPRSWLTTRPRDLAGALADGPLVVKDPRGSQGRGVVVTRTSGELAALGSGHPWLVMRYHPPEGPDLKVYRIGSELIGVERTFPATTYAAKLGRPVDVPPEVQRMVLRCGVAFGIEVYGVDVVRSEGRWWVVDMSSFPGFKGVADAGARIARHLVERGSLVPR